MIKDGNGGLLINLSCRTAHLLARTMQHMIYHLHSPIHVDELLFI